MGKKILMGLATAGIFLIPASFAFAASGTGVLWAGYPYESGVITGYSATLYNFGAYYGGSYTGAIDQYLTINGIAIPETQISCTPDYANSGTSCDASVTGLNIPFTESDDIEVAGDNISYINGMGIITFSSDSMCAPVANAFLNPYPGCTVQNCYNGAVQIGNTCVLPPSSSSVATSTAGGMLAAAENTINDPGVLEVVALTVGVYLSFYVLRQLIGLTPKRRGKK